MIGNAFNQYRITATIGAGAMGEVFRARDTRLNRDVAIKVLPKDFVSDADRLRRFEQEAKMLAALNHPNVLTIHDAGVHEGAPYLVSELLEGKTLRDEMTGAALPVRKATDYALQIADGLAAAHGKGIIHRDLKPENIFMTRDGRVKILDFGLAKLRQVGRGVLTASHDGDEASGGSLGTASPTIRIDADAIVNTTEPGMVLGTPAYMSPEQVRGEPADHRADIFALGCVLYEMLSGTRAFRRNTPVESMNAVLSQEPPELSASNTNISPTLERVVRRCLEKQPDNRFQSAKDLAFAIENAGTVSSSSSIASTAGQSHFGSRVLLPWAVAALSVVGLLFAILARKNSRDAATERSGFTLVRKFDLTLPPPVRKAPTTEFYFALSPDGKKFVYANGDGLWLRRLDQTTPLLLVAGEKIIDPFWSPQSTDVGYFAGRRVYRISISGGNPMAVGTAPEDVASGAAGGAWLGNRILFTDGWSGLLEVPAQGGRVVTASPPLEGEKDFHNVSALPDGRGVLFVVHRTVGTDTIGVWSSDGQRKVLLQLPGSSLWRPVFASTGHVLFHREDESRGVWAFPFSLEKLERTNEPFRVSDVGAAPSVAADGTLMLSLMGSDDYASRQLIWVERSGKILNTIGPPLPGLAQQSLSPDEQRVIVASGESRNATELWLLNLTGGGPIRITGNEQPDDHPRWWNGGRTIVFARSGKSGDQVMAKSADGAPPERLVIDGFMEDLSRSGKYLLVKQRSPTGSDTLGYVPMMEEPRKAVSFSEAFQRVRHITLSPDDRLLAYESIESGRVEVYVADFPGFTTKSVVSRGGGRHALWHPNGTELFYLSGDGRALMSGKLKPDGRGTEEPTKLFDLPESIHGGYSFWPSLYDVARDGERFLMLQKVQEDPTVLAAKPSVRVVQNWFEEHRDKK